MAKPVETCLIAIIGSGEANRTYKPPLRQPESVKQAAEEIGRELAENGCQILVFSSDPRFIEADFVRGYVSSPKAQPKSVQMRYPHSATSEFKEQQEHPTLFDLRPERGDWEVSFYQSLRDVDGIILIGGGVPTLITGLLAIAYRIPLLPIATFGAKALEVWERISSENCLATPNEITQMAQPWKPTSSAQAWVQSLLNQKQSLLNEQKLLDRNKLAQSKKTQRSALLSACMFILTVTLAGIGFSGGVTSYGILIGLLFACPLLAGVSGATIRTALDWTQDTTTDNTRSIVSTAAMGLVVGGLSGLLFIVAQMTTIPEVQGQDAVVAAITQAQTRRIIPFALLMGFIGGLTLDAVVRKLTSIDIIDTKAITLMGSSDASKHASEKN